MASFIFEEGTQPQASSFTHNDSLIFKTATPTTLGVVFTAAPNLTSVDTITLTLGTFSLQFAAASLETNTALTFLGGGTLTIGDLTGTTTASVGGAVASAAYLLDGNDTLTTIVGKGASIIDLGAGDDRTTVGTGEVGNYLISGGAGNDTIDATGAVGNLHIYGNGFGTTVGAADGSDLITVGHGASTSAVGTNYVNGNAGNDTITAAMGGYAGDVYRLNGGADNDTISVANEAAGAYASINGNTGNDIITGGNGGFDYLRGGQGDDSVTSGGASSQLFGDAGNDTLTTGAGANTINVLTGGAGNDVFAFVLNSAGQTHVLPTTPTSDVLAGYTTEIKDFTSGSDKIDLLNVNGTGSTQTQIGFNTNTSTTILTQQAGVTVTTAQAAEVYAQQLLDNAVTASAETVANKHYVAAIQVGSDTYLFSHESTSSAMTSAIDTAIKLDGVTATGLKAADFI